MLNWTAFASQQRVGLYWIVYPFLNQGRRIAWNGISGQGHKFIDAFPKELIKRISNAEMIIELKNGSVFQVMGADKPDRFVGANPVGMVFSEWPLMNPAVWRLTAPILNENGGWAVWIYTPRGENHGWDTLLQSGWRDGITKNTGTNDKGWFYSKLTAADCKVLRKEDLLELRDELKDEALFQQEAFTSFKAPIQGAYYDSQVRAIHKEKRYHPFPVESKLPVHTAWDLGFDDATSIWFFQIFGEEIRFVDYYENSGEGLLHYAKVLRTKDYLYGTHYGPWDMAIHDYGTGKTRIQTAKEMGLNFKVVKKLSVEEGIEACRNVLPRCRFNSDLVDQGFNGLKNYTKDWDEDKQVFKSKPLHNWASHPADAFRTFAVGLKDPKKKKRKLPTHCEFAHNPFK